MSEIRQAKFERIRQNGAFDAIVVGGGVNGIGVYRDLALQGLRVLLVERNDFCSGCSAAPSRMIHGGLRYLENGEFSLVRESLQERDALLRNAPHMVRPLPTVIPITSVLSGLLNGAASFFGLPGKPSNRGVVPIKLGLMLYDWVIRNSRLMPKHHFNTRKVTQQKWPELTSTARFSAVYHDAWITHPERMCLEMIKDTEGFAPDCIALNYAELRLEQGQYLMMNNLMGEELRLSSKIIVNASGAWLDSAAQSLRAEKVEKMVEGTKGSHLILKNEALVQALDGHMVYFENTDGRVCIAFPYQGHVLAGSTDIRVDTPRRESCGPEEQAYILGSLALVFPRIDLNDEQVVFSFSGIRPLPVSNQGYTGRISRGHYLRRLDGDVPQICMIGGKWTTFRAFAQDTTDEVLHVLGRKRKQSTLDLPIGGGAGFTKEPEAIVVELCQRFDLSAARARHLVDHYGSDATKVQMFCAGQEDSFLSSDTLYTHAEISYLIQTEGVETLSDIALRRTSLAITGELSLLMIDVLAQIFEAERSFSPTTVAEQRQILIDELSRFHGVSLEMLQERNGERNMEWSKQCG